MKREILFRGKRLDNGQWVEGDVQVPNKETLHVFDKWFMWDEKNIQRQVDPETVGQFTGITDKNGKKVFEGDRGIHDVFGEVYVKYLIQECGFVYVSKDSDHRMGRRNIIRCGYEFDNNFEITCNIHDNPELL